MIYILLLAIVLHFILLIILFKELFRFFKLPAEERASNYCFKHKKRFIVLFIGIYILIFMRGFLCKFVIDGNMWNGIGEGLGKCAMAFVYFRHYIELSLFAFLLYFDHKAKK